MWKSDPWGAEGSCWGPSPAGKGAGEGVSEKTKSWRKRQCCRRQMVQKMTLQEPHARAQGATAPVKHWKTCAQQEPGAEESPPDVRPAGGRRGGQEIGLQCRPAGRCPAWSVQGLRVGARRLSGQGQSTARICTPCTCIAGYTVRQEQEKTKPQQPWNREKKPSSALY